MRTLGALALHFLFTASIATSLALSTDRCASPSHNDLWLRLRAQAPNSNHFRRKYKSPPSEPEIVQVAPRRIRRHVSEVRAGKSRRSSPESETETSRARERRKSHRGQRARQQVSLSLSISPPSTSASRRRELLTSRRTSGQSRAAETLTSDNVLAAIFHDTSWECQLERYWRRQPSGTFPAYIQTGRCRRTPCMLGMYDCVPRRYTVKVLQRVPDQCVPLPVVGNVTGSANGGGGGVGFEEAWRFVDRPVVVGCSCSRRRRSGTHRLLQTLVAPRYRK